MKRPHCKRCLDRITEVTDELKRLMEEFEKELAILKGRVDGLEAVGELEATQFSTTTGFQVKRHMSSVQSILRMLPIKIRMMLLVSLTIIASA